MSGLESSITRKTKLRLYKALVITVLMYRWETWKMNKGDDRMIDVSQNKCLRKVLRIRWQEHITTKEVLVRAEIRPISIEVKRRRSKMIDHILRRGKDNDINIALTWAPGEGRKEDQRPRGGEQERKKENEQIGNHW